MVKFSNILFRKFSPFTDRRYCIQSKVVKFVRREINGIVRYLPHKKFGFLSNCRCEDSVQNLPVPSLKIWLAMFQISSKSVRFRRIYSRTREEVLLAHRVFAIFALERITIKLLISLVNLESNCC